MEKTFYDIALNWPPAEVNTVEVESHLQKQKDHFARYKIAPSEVIIWQVPQDKRAEVVMPVLKILEKEKAPLILRCLKRG